LACIINDFKRQYYILDFYTTFGFLELAAFRKEHYAMTPKNLNFLAIELIQRHPLLYNGLLRARFRDNAFMQSSSGTFGGCDLYSVLTRLNKEPD
jgi:hypothetical protein